MPFRLELDIQVSLNIAASAIMASVFMPEHDLASSCEQLGGPVLGHWIAYPECMATQKETCPVCWLDKNGTVTCPDFTTAQALTRGSVEALNLEKVHPGSFEKLRSGV